MLLKKYWLSLGLVFFSLHSFAYENPLLDSTGIEKKGGKTYIVHKVEAKETLYSLSRRYGASVEDIKKANEDQGDLKVGQSILIPTKNVSTAVVHPASVKTHTVEAKETLYSISRKYGVSVDELKKANPNVPVDDMKVGQMLVLPKNAKIPAEDKTTTTTPVENTPKSTGSSPNPKTHVLQPKETLYALSRKYEVTVDDLKKANPSIDINSMEVGQVINIPPKSAETHADVRKVTPPQKEEKKAPIPVTTETKKEEKKSTGKTLPKAEANLPEIKRDGYTKVNESGFVEMYEANTDFHYALHSTAPIGTIVLIENEDSGQKVYVRVMGKLTDAAPGTFMKISRKAYEKVSKGEAKIKVSTSYIP